MKTRAFPYHAHRANEEMFFILDGEGSIRIAGTIHKLRKGDFISLPPGPESAHQIVNDSSAPNEIKLSGKVSGDSVSEARP